MGSLKIFFLLPGIFKMKIKKLGYFLSLPGFRIYYFSLHKGIFYVFVIRVTKILKIIIFRSICYAPFIYFNNAFMN